MKNERCLTWNSMPVHKRALWLKQSTTKPNRNREPPLTRRFSTPNRSACICSVLYLLLNCYMFKKKYQKYFLITGYLHEQFNQITDFTLDCKHWKIWVCVYSMYMYICRVGLAQEVEQLSCNRKVTRYLTLSIWARYLTLTHRFVNLSINSRFW